jgi:hypothetical protein
MIQASRKVPIASIVAIDGMPGRTRVERSLK